MARVFVVEEPMYRDPTTGVVKPKFDLRLAAAYGDVQILLDDTRALNTGPMIHTLRRKLAKYTSDDYILPVGNPAAMSLAVAVAAVNNRGWVNILLWHRETRKYVCVKANVYGKRAA